MVHYDTSRRRTWRFIQKKKKKKKRGWAKWRPYDEDATSDFSKITVMNQKGESQKEGLETIQEALRRRQRGSRTPRNLTDKKEVGKTPKEDTVREAAAARSSRPTERKVLMEQARAEHAVKCGLMHGKRISKRRPVTELYVHGSSTEDRGAWEK